MSCAKMVAVLSKLATTISINLTSNTDNCPLAMLVTGANKIFSAQQQENGYDPSVRKFLVTKQDVAVNEYSLSSVLCWFSQQLAQTVMTTVDGKFTDTHISRPPEFFILHSDTLLPITDFCPVPLAFLFSQKVSCYFGHKLLYWLRKSKLFRSLKLSQNMPLTVTIPIHSKLNSTLTFEKYPIKCVPELSEYVST